MQHSELLAVADAAAQAAVEVHQRHVGRVRLDEWSNKGSADFVSHVDHEAEARITETILSAFPDHRVMAEEEVSSSGIGVGARWREVEWLWIVDPLDGTTNFLHGYPMYAASIAVLHRGDLKAGVVACGPTGEMWRATAGGGATRNGAPIQVSRIETLRPALIGTGFPFKNLDLMPGYLRQFDTVMRHTSGVRRAGSAALDLCHVASGYCDGFWELDLYPWDIAAGTLLVREAGGVVTSLTGELDLFERTGVLAGNPRIHEKLGRLLQELES